MAKQLTLTVNGQQHRLKAEPDTPLLYVLRNDLGLKGPHFGCGLAQCGACTVHVGAKSVRSCVVPAGTVTEPVTTLDGLAAAYRKKKRKPAGTLHPLQQAFIDEQAVQCGYCINGWIMEAAAFLEKNKNPTEAEIRTAMKGVFCRCSQYLRIHKAIKRAAQAMG
jgi:nicotinate dehydrogenase subunit A